MIARPLWPITSESTDSMLILASSKVFCTRCTWPAFSRTSCLRVRSSPRSSWIAGCGTKLARTSPCANNSDSHVASFTSVLRPGTFFTCTAFARMSSKLLSASTCHTGFQYTPVASIATCVQPFSSSHSLNSIRPAVVVANVRTKCDASLPAVRRTHATTVSLCTSRPAQRGYITSMISSPVAPSAWGTSIEKLIKRAPDREGHWHIQGCPQYPRSNSFSGSRHQNNDDLCAGGPPSLAPVSSSRVGRRPVSNSFDHLISAQQERLGNGQTKRLGRRQIDDEIKFDRLLDRQALARRASVADFPAAN